MTGSTISRELLRGTLEMIVLGRVRTPTHGYAIASFLRANQMKISPATLYPVLGRLELDGSVKGTWRNGPGRRRRRVYRITARGSIRLREMLSDLERARDLAHLAAISPVEK